MFRLVLALAALLLLVAPSSAEDEAAALLAKHRAYAGWTLGDSAFASGLVLTGTQGPLTLTELRRGVLFRQTTGDPATGIGNSRGFTGSRFWATGINGFRIPIVGDAQKYQIARYVLLDEGFTQLHGTSRGRASVGGNETAIVRVTPPNADALDVYLDPHTGALRRGVIDPGGAREATIDVLGEGEVDGKRVVTSWRVNNATPVTTTAATRAVTDAELTPPKPAATWTFGQPAAVPLLDTKTRIGFRAKVNGVEGNFILDSGASGIAFTPEFADRAHLSGVASITAYGVSGPVQASRAKAETIAVGGNVLHNVWVQTGARIASSRENYDGLFGFDFLAGAIVDVDRKHGALVLYDPATNAATENGYVILADLTTGVPTVPATLQPGNVQANLLFDTGAPFNVIAGYEMYEKYRIKMAIDGYARLSGVGGTSQEISPCGTMESIDLGALKYTGVKTCYAKGTTSFGSTGGLIGMDFLGHFDLTFDYPDGKIVLTPLK